MPQGRRKRQDGPTKEEVRRQERHAAAEKAVSDYEPRGEDDPIFAGSRDHVAGQFAIAFELQERYEALLAERKANREQLRGLQTQRLLSTDEAILSHELYPARASEASENGGEPVAAEAAA